MADVFDADELALVRSLFRDEARELLRDLEQLLAGTAPLSAASLSHAMRTTHTFKGSAATVQLSELAQRAHRLEDCLAALQRSDASWNAEIAGAALAVLDSLHHLVDADVAGEELLASIDDRLTTLAQVTGARRADAVLPLAQPDRAGTFPSPAPSAVRVSPDHIDKLIALTAELGFDRARLERHAEMARGQAGKLASTRQQLQDELHVSGRDLPPRIVALEAELAAANATLARVLSDLVADSEAMKRTESSLAEQVRALRLVSAAELFQRVLPIARDAARESRKQVSVRFEGEDVQIDRLIGEQLAPCLLQLVRNAVIHGVESPAERGSVGKSPAGQLVVRVAQDDAHVVMELTDDGAGVQPEAIRAALRKSALWPEQKIALASEAELLDAVFSAGLSTRIHADEWAGRGVGLDVVRDTLAKMGGSVQLRSQAGLGSQFTLRVPCEAALSHAYLFKLGDVVYALLNVHVVDTGHTPCALGMLPATFSTRESRLPLVNLHAEFDVPISFDRETLPVLLVEHAGVQFALACDRVVGPRTIVVKELDPLLAPLPWYSGATISASGKVQPILDATMLRRLAFPQGADEADHAFAGRALVVDDQASVRAALSRLLHRVGLAVDVAASVESAWQKLATYSYDIVFTDLEMPGADGFELIARMRADAARVTLPVVVVSSRADSKSRERAQALGVFRFLTKPVRLRDLSGVIRDLKRGP